MSYIAKRTEGAAGAPLFLTFHGTGGDEHQFHDIATELVPGAHVVSPRGDVSENGMARYFKRTGEGRYDMADLARATKKLASFIEGEIDRTEPERIIALGYSNGANIIAALAFERPDLFDEIVLLHPLIPFEPKKAKLDDLRVLITAGENDPICPPDLTADLIEYFDASGAEVDAIWHSGGHEIAKPEVQALKDFFDLDE